MDSAIGNTVTGHENDWDEDSPVYTEEGFDTLVRDIAADEMPRLFAVVYEQVPRQGAEVAAYGLAFRDRAELIAPDGASRMTSSNADQATALLAASTGDEQVKAHLVWISTPVGARV
ncbi:MULTISPECIES: hypothetical protein [Actinosynnema]|uniref:hypothetical protein n=1 Tax=Actinosynnema TaxID=40566 RepID=UPI0020A41A2D|nr:hypothetical protein [Actinosynnema pretiosum]MCP2098117.1 hypothetical protein [Actinosynnema pretiosum]